MFFILLPLSVIYAHENIYVHHLKSNMIPIYEVSPQEVDSFSDMFLQGIFYGRLRMNSFGFRWDTEVEGKRKNHAIAAVGGSLIYKSAYFHGFAVTAGLYTSQVKGSLDRHKASLYKAGKDAFSRYDLLTEGERGMTSLAEGYLEYKHYKSSLKVGRQLFESFLTKSNDTKMIPNAFEGFTLSSKTLPHTHLKMGYFTKQKLRDHSTFHHMLAYGDDPNDPYAQYSQNDDSNMHRGLKQSELQALGIDDRLMVFEVENKSVNHLTFHANYTAVPKLLSYMMLQADYKVDVGDWSVIPSFRYMKQFDDGAGVIGGANRKMLSGGYKNPTSLDSTLYAARVDVQKDTFKLRFGYTDVLDEGDIIAPWRGFPTGGFTRAMGQYNWDANTKSYMLQMDYTFESMPDLQILSRYVVQNFDDNKVGVQADTDVFTLDVAKIFEKKQLYVKTRYAHVMGKSDTIVGNGVHKADSSYDEIRVEMNYLF